MTVAATIHVEINKLMMISGARWEKERSLRSWSQFEFWSEVYLYTTWHVVRRTAWAGVVSVYQFPFSSSLTHLIASISSHMLLVNFPQRVSSTNHHQLTENCRKKTNFISKIRWRLLPALYSNGRKREKNAQNSRWPEMNGLPSAKLFPWMKCIRELSTFNSPPGISTQRTVELRRMEISIIRCKHRRIGVYYCMNIWFKNWKLNFVLAHWERSNDIRRTGDRRHTYNIILL